MTVVIGSQLAGQVMHGVSRKRDPSFLQVESVPSPHSNLSSLSHLNHHLQSWEKIQGLDCFLLFPPIYQLCLVLKTSTSISTTKLPITKKNQSWRLTHLSPSSPCWRRCPLRTLTIVSCPSTTCCPFLPALTVAWLRQIPLWLAE